MMTEKKKAEKQEEFYSIANEQIEFCINKYREIALIKYYSLIHIAKILAKQSIELSQEQRKWIDEIVEKKCIHLIKKASTLVDTFVENPNADNRLYYFRFIFKNKKYYKIGITSQTLKDRYGNEYNKIEKILYDKRIDGAIRIEKEIKEKFKKDIFPLAYLNNGGHTETFDKDILDLDS